MEELFTQEGQSIFCFKPGDLIIRAKPVILKKPYYNENLGIAVEVDAGIDNSFRREPGEFVGIYNNLIYVKHMEKRMFMIFRVKPRAFRPGI